MFIAKALELILLGGKKTSLLGKVLHSRKYILIFPKISGMVNKQFLLLTL